MSDEQEYHYAWPPRDANAACEPVMPVVGDRMSYPGTLSEVEARQVFGDGLVDVVNAGINDQPPLKSYRVWRAEVER